MVMLPELTGKLPLRTCRGVVAHFQLQDVIRYNYLLLKFEETHRYFFPVSLISSIIL